MQVACRGAPMPEIAQPLYVRLRDQLRADILEGRRAPGEQLPSESELGARHGVSRITVRQALADLQSAGLIVRQQGKGAFVAPPQATQRLERLEGLAEALAQQGQAVHSRQVALRTVRAPEAVARALGLAPRTEVVQLQSLRYLDRAPLSFSVSHFVPGLGERLARIDLAGRDLLEVMERDLALPVRQAQVEIRAEALSARDARLLKAEPGSPGLRIDRLVLAEGEQPLHTESAVYPADRFSYRLTLGR